MPLPQESNTLARSESIEAGGTWIRAGSDLGNHHAGFPAFRSRMERTARLHGLELRVEAQLGYWQGVAEPSGRIIFAAGADPERAARVLQQVGERLGQDAMILFTEHPEGTGGAFEIPIEPSVTVGQLEAAIRSNLPHLSASICAGIAYFYERDWDRGERAAAGLASALGSDWFGRRGTLTMVGRPRSAPTAG